MTSLLWFRRDLRLQDHPALLSAAARGPVLPVFVLDPSLLAGSGAPRVAYLLRSLHALDAALDGRLVVRQGRAADVVPALAVEVGADEVHVSADYTPYGHRRDEAVEAALGQAGRRLVRTGSPYAVAPGRLHSKSGGPFQVFTPFYKAWLAHGWRGPAQLAASVQWATADSDALPAEPVLAEGTSLFTAGESAAHEVWQRFRDKDVQVYGEERNRPDLDSSSHLSVHLKYGELHPRTLLADLGELRGKGVDAFRRQLTWREFFADVLWHQPHTSWDYLRPEMAGLRYDTGPRADELFAAWRDGRTGYPFVDAGMRQLAATGWLHNRVRLVVASFLTKDLHLEWQRGAKLFMDRLVDADLASNNESWQWVAGSGVDAAPYYRVFNPVTQGLRFDPEGDYVRRWVPELVEVPGGAVHEPWDLPGGLPAGYPQRVLDHAAERIEALERWEAVRARR